MRYATLIGSRKIPADKFTEMSNAAYHLVSLGYTIRSGKAKGSDEAAQLGVQGYHRTENKGSKFVNIESLAEIYIPWKGFSTPGLWSTWDIVPWNMTRCMEIASTIHPAWSKLSKGAKLLHSRNISQVLGQGLATPSDLVLFYAEERNGEVLGGTRTAVVLARQNNIPTVNMYFDDWKEKIREVLNER